MTKIIASTEDTQSDSRNEDKATAPEKASDNDKSQSKGRKGRKAARRAKGTGSLERHGRTWRAVWVVDGKTFRRTTGTANEREAKEKLAEFIAPYRLKMEARKDAKASKSAVAKGFDAAALALADAARAKRIEAGRKSVPLAKAWETFNTSPRRNPIVKKLNDLYESRFDAFLDWAKKNRPSMVGVADVDSEAAEAFMRQLRGKVAPKTYNDYRALFAQMWTVLDMDAGLYGANPWREIKPLPKETHIRRELTAEELARVVAPLEGEMRVLFALGIYTGLRLGDCVNLNWGAIDLVRGFVQWTPRKTRRHGTIVRIPLFPALASILSETPSKRRRGLILPGLAEEYGRYASYVCERVQRVFAQAGIETQGDTGRINPKKGTPRKAVEVGFHSLRHTFVSLCANAGVPLHIVQAIVGHTQAAMTTHYFHVSDDALRGAVAVLPDVFEGGPAAALPAPKGESVEIGTGTAIQEETETFEAVPARVAKIARMLAGCSDATLAKVEKYTAKLVAKEG